MCVCWFVCWSAFYRPHDICPLCGAAPEYSESSQAVAHGPARAAGKHAHSESTRAHAVQLLNEKITALMPFKNKSVRARACCRIRYCRDFQKKGRRKPTCHFPSSVYSLPSLGVFTFRIVLKSVSYYTQPTTIIYTYKRVVCVCWFVCLFVCLLFIGHTTFVHFAALPPSGRGGPARADKHAQREHARACRTTSQRKNRSADAFQKQSQTRAHAVVNVTAEIFKKREKENQHATSQVQYTVCLLLECLLFESY